MTYLRPKPWRSRASFAGHLAASRRRGSYSYGGGDDETTGSQAPDDVLDGRGSQLPVTVGTVLAIEQADAVRTVQGRIDESGLLAFQRRTADAKHEPRGGRALPSITTGRRSA